jgi:hypothetical protein
LVIKMTLKGARRRFAYGAVQNELRQGIRTVNARFREERRTLGRDTQQLSRVDWLQQQATMDDPMLLNSCASLAAELRPTRFLRQGPRRLLLLRRRPSLQSKGP